jgi:hypothetical protein
VYVTTVVPTGKNCPGVLLLAMLTVQLSATVGGIQVTFVPQVPAVASALAVIVDGQPEIDGGVISLT